MVLRSFNRNRISTTALLIIMFHRIREKKIDMCRAHLKESINFVVEILDRPTERCEWLDRIEIQRLKTTTKHLARNNSIAYIELFTHFYLLFLVGACDSTVNIHICNCNCFCVIFSSFECKCAQYTRCVCVCACVYCTLKIIYLPERSFSLSFWSRSVFGSFFLSLPLSLSRIYGLFALF